MKKEEELGNELIQGIKSISILNDQEFELSAPDSYDIETKFLGKISKFGVDNIWIDITLNKNKVEFVHTCLVPSSFKMQYVPQYKVLLRLQLREAMDRNIKSIQRSINSILREKE